MKSTEERIELERKECHLIEARKKKLIEDGLFPSKYSFPISMQFEVTSRCNLHCKHCYNQSGTSQFNDAVSGEQWVDFCKYIVAHGGLFQATISGGEPLLLGNYLWKIMDVLHADNTIFNLISNGYLFDRNVIERIKCYRFFWVQISLDSYKQEIHDAFRGVNGSYLRAARAAYSIALAGLPLRIASTITPQSIGHLEEFVYMAMNLGASYLVVGEVMPSGRAYDNPAIFLSDYERSCFHDEMDKLKKKYKNDISILISGSERVQLEYVSSGSIEGAIIRPNGDIRMDCTCPFVIGNILKDDLAEVWAKKSDCWQNPLVQKYIASCNPLDGTSNIIKNYKERDIEI